MEDNIEKARKVIRIGEEKKRKYTHATEGCQNVVRGLHSTWLEENNCGDHKCLVDMGRN